MVVRGFYDYHWRMEDDPTNIKDKTTTYLPARARRYKSFLHHITKGSPVTKNILRQKEEKQPQPKVLTKDQVQTLLDACSHRRDRLLIWLLYESAARISEILSLFLEGVDVAEKQTRLCHRVESENDAALQ